MAEGTVVPKWVDERAESLARDFMVVAGPAGIVLLGRLGQERGIDRWLWQSAAHMETSVFDDSTRAITGPHKKAILTRLRRLANAQATMAPFHPQSVDGETYRSDDRQVWYHMADGQETRLGGEPDCVAISAHTISNYGVMTRLGLSTAEGA